jgi:hypothetical protein
MSRNLIILALAALLSFASYAETPSTDPWAANTWDKFSINNDHGIHMIGAFATTYFGALLLEKAGMPKTTAILTSVLISYAAWTAKEFYHDQFASSGDNTSNLIGVGAGAIFSFGFLDR